MIPSIAARIKKHRRTNSTPGNCLRAAHNRTLPDALTRALFGARVGLEAFHITTLKKSSDSDPATDATEPKPCVMSAPMLNIHEDDMQDIFKQMQEHAEETNGHEEDDARRDDGSPVRSDSDDVTVATEDTEEYDTDNAKYYMTKLRDIRGHCSEKMVQFAQELWVYIGQGEEGLKVFGRDAMAAPALKMHRKHRLFGSKEPDLHQRVLGVLNKVTDDTGKYREIKNEMLRLPIPEADPTSLEEVVRVFFAKAVREQRFSAHYADLFEELCRPGPNQTAMSMKDSLSYRLRATLLTQCKREFFSHDVSTTGTTAASPEMDQEERDAMEAQEKKRLCGNVKFVGELFLRKMVSAKIIQLILCKLLFGSDNPDVLNAPLPPKYIPEAYECDQFITLLMTTGPAFAKSEIGPPTLDSVMRIVAYFAKMHPVTRITFLFQNLMEDVRRGFSKKPLGVHPAPVSTTVASASHAAPLTSSMHASSALPVPHGSHVTVGGLSAAHVHHQNHHADPTSPIPTASHHQGGTTPALSIPPPMSQQQQKGGSSTPASTTGTPQPLRGAPNIMTPQPRSAAARELGFTERQTSPTSSSATPPATQAGKGFAGKSVLARPPSGAPTAPSIGTKSPPPQPTAGSSGRSSVASTPAAAPVQSRPPASKEAVIHMMSSLTTSGDFATVAAELVSQYDVLNTLSLWVQRALAVIRAEKSRFQLAGILKELHSSYQFERQTLRDVCLSALRSCIDDGLYQDEYRLWRYWAQIVAGDKAGDVLDDDMHNDALRMVLKLTSEGGASAGAQKDVIAEFIGDVLGVEKQVFTLAGCRTSKIDESTPYARFRPLSVLTDFNLQTSKVPNFTLDMVTSPAITKLQDTELLVFTALLRGAPSKEALRDVLRNEERFSNPLTPAKVLSALYHAEFAFETRNLLDSHLDLLVFVVDFQNRDLRELALVMELHLCCSSLRVPRTMMEGNRWMSRMKVAVTVTPETHAVAHRLLRNDPDVDVTIGPLPPRDHEKRKALTK